MPVFAEPKYYYSSHHTGTIIIFIIIAHFVVLFSGDLSEGPAPVRADVEHAGVDVQVLPAATPCKTRGESDIVRNLLTFHHFM